MFIHYKISLIRNLFVSIAGLIGLVLLPVAQQAHAANSDTLEEIVVTAQKREQNLQDTSVSMTAFTGDVLREIGATNMFDYFRLVPGLNIYSAQPGEGKITIRGVGDGVNTGNLGPTTGYYLDESPVTLVDTNPDLKLFDIERVEVLRGPQGTLYGISSMGGTIRVITNKPDASAYDSAFELGTYSTHEGDASYNGSGMVNIPLVEDQLAMRVVGYYYLNGGFIDAPNLGKDDVNEEETWGGRISMRWTPTDNINIVGSIVHQDTELDGRFYSSGNQPDPLVTLAHIDEPGGDEFTSYNLTMDFDFGSGTLTSATSYFERTQRNTLDFTPLSVAFPFVPDGNWVQFRTERDVDTFAQELRYATHFDGPVQFLVGGFYQDTHEYPFQYAPAEDGDANTSAFFGGNPPPGILLGPAWGIPDSIVLFLNDEEIRNKALFGEVYWNFAPQWTATVGARWFHNKDTILSSSYGVAGNPGAGVSTQYSNEKDVNFKFKLEYQVSDDVLVYAQAAQGFRSGGQNNAIIGPPFRPADQYDSDTLWNYELAAKSTLADGRLIANLAVYYTDWSDMQVQVPFPPLGSFIGNAGTAEILGAEAELVFSPLQGLEFMATIGWTDAEFTETVNPGAGIRDGVQLPGVPEFNFAGAIQYSRPLSDTLDWYVRGDYQHVGDSYSSAIASANQDPNNRIGDYDLVDFRTGILFEKWEFGLFVENLTDERARLATNFGFPRSEIQRNRPRSIGLTVRYSY